MRNLISKVFKNVPAGYGLELKDQYIDHSLMSYTYDLFRQISVRDNCEWQSVFLRRYAEGRLFETTLSKEGQEYIEKYCQITSIIEKRDVAVGSTFLDGYKIKEHKKLFDEVFQKRREELEEKLLKLERDYFEKKVLGNSIGDEVANDLGLDAEKFWVAAVWLKDYVDSIHFPQKYTAEKPIDTIQAYVKKVDEIENCGGYYDTSFVFTASFNEDHINTFNNGFMLILRDALRDYLNKYENEQPQIDFYVDYYGEHRVELFSEEHDRLYNIQNYKGSAIDGLFKDPEQHKVSKNMKLFIFYEQMTKFLRSHFKDEINGRRSYSVVQELCRLFGYLDDNSNKSQLHDTLKGIKTDGLKFAESKCYL